ncbi:FbpB family small basic protein [Bacillus altitudinis]|nr:FbpB family small basic protein [Bacillus stratosphericus]MCM3046501.1 FbpB family small basic protein [Bacillus altitudinis]MCA2384346.1 FbpB family small basic protein [Bacillus stratosphericus]MCA2397890.1 FbpB family small basic protein [Bacillus stratosphericus]MCM3062919.1 FbpB family small basic protein [Bacillus altitudinis]
MKMEKKKKRKKYRKHLDITLDILIERNKYEIYSNQERIEEIYDRIDEKHTRSK